MKKLALFAISFILLFTVLQILSGIILTAIYTPNIENAWNSSAELSSQAVISSSQNPFFTTLLIGLIAAVVAYFIPKRFVKN